MNEQGPPTTPLPPPPPAPVDNSALTEPLPRDLTSPRGPRRPNIEGRRLLLVIGGLVVIGLIAFAAIQLTAADEPDPKPGLAAIADNNENGPAAAKARFIKRADRICDRAAARQEKMLFPDTLDDFVAYADRNVALIEDLVRDLKALKAPPQDRVVLSKMFAAADKQLKIARQIPRLAANGNTVAIDIASKKVDLLSHKIDAFALSYGMIDCGVNWNR